MMSKFVHLHTHSHYSLLDGLGKIDELIGRAVELKMPALALTDHGNLYGAIEFYTKAKKAGIKPIIGCEIYLARRSMADRTPKIDIKPYHLTLLAKNKEGYFNLIKIVTAAHLQGFYYKPRIDKEFLKNHTNGLIALSGCFLGEIPRMVAASNFEAAKRTAQEYQEIFSGDFYLELQNHPKIEGQEEILKGLVRLSQEAKIPVVATTDIHYILPEDKEPHDILLQVSSSNFEGERRLEMKMADLWMKSEEEMEESFRGIPKALENTLKITSECNLEIPLGEVSLPDFKVPSSYTPESYLKKLCLQGLKKRYGENPKKEIKERLQYELSVIEKTGFASYFLIVADFVIWAKKQGILVGPGRGSAAGSLTSYVLGITDIDPIKYNLIFERFLNPERVALPDIDLDFQDDRRDEVIEYLVSRYGQEHVAQIITFGTMAARAAVRDTGRALGMSYPEVDSIAKLVAFNLPLKRSLEISPPLGELYKKDPQVKKLIDTARRLEGVARHASTHAAGVVVSPQPLINYLPLQKASKGEISWITQYSMYDIEEIGLLKIDLLGLSNLTILKNTLEIIGKKIDLKKIPFDDEKTYKLLSSGETIGVFQLESEGMRRYLQKLKPSNFEDIISMIALYRPGPVESLTDFIEGKHGRRKISYLHPTLKPILEKTYGVIVTQDQVLEIAQKFAGFSYSEADILRKAVGKKIKKLLISQKKKFIEGAVKTSKTTPQVAEKVWNFIEPFARYGFNRAHAACYALIAYWTAYLKAHFTSCFMAALMTSDKDNIEKISKEVGECQRLGIKVLPPSVNESYAGFAVTKEDNIRFALGAIKNIGEGIISAIVSERKKGGIYKSIDDFASRVSCQELNRKALESLAKSGAMDCLEKREAILTSIDQILTYAARRQKSLKEGQIDIFSSFGLEGDLGYSLKLSEVSEIPQDQKLAWEKELLGIYVSSHPLLPFLPHLKKFTIPFSKLEGLRMGEKVKVGGIIAGLQRINTRAGKPMLFLKLEDETSSGEILVFPSTLEKYSSLFGKDKIVLIEGKLTCNKEGERKVICEEAEELDLGKLTKSNLSLPPGEIEKRPLAAVGLTGRRLIIEFPKDGDLTLFKKIQEILTKKEGDFEVFLKINGKKIKLPQKIDFGEKERNKIEELLGKERIKTS